VIAVHHYDCPVLFTSRARIASRSFLVTILD
jgi:hypothetical protein